MVFSFQQPAARVFTAETAHIHVPLLVKLVETQTDFVLVNQDGWVLTVQLVIFFRKKTINLLITDNKLLKLYVILNKKLISNDVLFINKV